MMDNRFFLLAEKYLNNELSAAEKEELNTILLKEPKIKEDLEEQKKIKEVLNKMTLKNPSKEMWDGYWLVIYNRIERGIAWVAVSVGFIIVAVYGVIQAVESFLNDTQIPGIIKFGIAVLVIGVIILLFSVLREKFFTHKKDKYKEVQR
jgi:hypothetical protein